MPDPLRVFVAKNLYLGLILPKHMVPVEAPVPLSERQTFAFMIVSEKRFFPCMPQIVPDGCFGDFVTPRCYHKEQVIL